MTSHIERDACTENAHTIEEGGDDQRPQQVKFLSQDNLRDYDTLVPETSAMSMWTYSTPPTLPERIWAKAAQQSSSMEDRGKKGNERGRDKTN